MIWNHVIDFEKLCKYIFCVPTKKRSQRAPFNGAIPSVTLRRQTCSTCSFTVPMRALNRHRRATHTRPALCAWTRVNTLARSRRRAAFARFSSGVSLRLPAAAGVSGAACIGSLARRALAQTCSDTNRRRERTRVARNLLARNGLRHEAGGRRMTAGRPRAAVFARSFNTVAGRKTRRRHGLFRRRDVM